MIRRRKVELNRFAGTLPFAAKIKRFDIRDGSIEVSYYLDISTSKKLSELTEELRNTFPKTGVTFLDQNQLPSI